jgi:hypothetical protein
MDDRMSKGEKIINFVYCYQIVESMHEPA